MRMWPGSDAVGGRERFGGDRADLRIVGGRRLPAAGEHHVRALAVIVFARVDAAHEAQVVHLLGRFGSSSQMWMPGTEVGIARNGPPVAVPGLGSQLSSWLRPPCMLNTTIRF